MPNIIIEDAHGKRIEVEVSDVVAIYLEENKRYMKRLEKIDERHFRLIHFDKRAWENMQGLSTEYSTEDEYLGIPEEKALLELEEYQRRLAWCRLLLRHLQDACTQTQWRRYELYVVNGYSLREIAQAEGVNWKSVEESINAVKKKIKNIISNEG